MGKVSSGSIMSKNNGPFQQNISRVFKLTKYNKNVKDSFDIIIKVYQFTSTLQILSNKLCC